MPDYFFDQNGIDCFIDRNNVSCFVDQGANLLCCGTVAPVPTVSLSASPKATTIYTIMVTGPGGTASALTKVTVRGKK